MYFKRKIRNWKRTRGEPGTDSKFTVIFPSLNFKRNYNKVILENTSITDSLYIDDEMSFISTLSYNHNLKDQNILTFKSKSNESLVENPMLKIG